MWLSTVMDCNDYLTLKSQRGDGKHSYFSSKWLEKVPKICSQMVFFHGDESIPWDPNP